MLAVSDKTFARLAAMVEPAVRSALVAVNLKHAGWFDTPDTTAERQVAEDAYQGEAIDKEHARLKKLHDATWRRGDAETPEPPTRREVMKDMARQLVNRVCELATKAYREVEHLVTPPPPLPEPLRSRDREQERTHGRDYDRDFGPSR